MAIQFTLSFEGLCAFVGRGTQIEAYLPSGHGDHGANLIIRSDSLFIPNTTWKPTTVGMVYEGGVPTQVAIWDLRGEDLLVQSSHTATGMPKWDKTHLIDFAADHPKVTTLPARDILAADKRAGWVRLVGDTSQLKSATPNSVKDKFELAKKSVSYKIGEFTRILEWQPVAGEVPVFKNARGQVIELRLKTNAWGCVANVATVSSAEGLKHFHHYYEGLSALPAGDDRMTISNKFVDVYDCVPPVGWP